MGTYQVPRDVKGEGRIFFVFSKKALVYTAIGVFVGFLFSLIFSIFNLSIVGYILMGLLGGLGFVIGTFKMPDTTAFDITKKTGGEKIDDVIVRAIKFKRAGKRIYINESAEKLREALENPKDKKEAKDGK